MAADHPGRRNLAATARSAIGSARRRVRRASRRARDALDTRLDDLRARRERVDTSELETVSVLLGPYRNLTTLVTTLLALHPSCQVLNHAGGRVFRHRGLDFIADPRPETLEAFARYAIALSAGGKQGDYGGSILLSHAFEREAARQRYAARFGDLRVKPVVRSLVWKESMVVTNRLRRLSSLEPLLALEKLRFVHPLRDPIDCAHSNLSTGHVRHLGARPGDLGDVVRAILEELEWFCELKAAHPARCFLLIEDEVDEARLEAFAAFHEIDADRQWLDDAASVYRLGRPYPVPAAVLEQYRRQVDDRFARFPEIRNALLRLGARHEVV